MKSDIILNDENVEIIGSKITMKTDLSHPGLKRCSLIVGDSTLANSAAFINVTDVGGKTSISSTKVSSKRFTGDSVNVKTINAEKILAKEIEVGPSADDLPSAPISKVVVKNKKGLAAITLDGENEDIILTSIGSLTKKIMQLEAEINALKRRIP